MTERTESGPTKKCSNYFRCGCPTRSPNFKLQSPRLHSGAGCDRPENTKKAKLQPIPEVVWQQPLETCKDQHSLNNVFGDSTIQYTREFQMTKVASQMSAAKGTQPQNYVTATEQPPGYQTGNEPVPCLSCSNSCHTDTQESSKHTLPVMEIKPFPLS